MPPSTLTRAVAGLLVLGALGAAGASTAAAHPGDREPLVVRGDATAVDGPCDARACAVALTDGRFRGTLGTGGYTAALTLRVGATFPNGEDGVCAPLSGRIVLGAGTPDRLVLGVSGDSCQDGAGPLETASFTGVVRFTVKHGSGAYRRAAGNGLATFAEDAANRHRMTLVGSITAP